MTIAAAGMQVLLWGPLPAAPAPFRQMCGRQSWGILPHFMTLLIEESPHRHKQTGKTCCDQHCSSVPLTLQSALKAPPQPRLRPESLCESPLLGIDVCDIAAADMLAAGQQESGVQRRQVPADLLI